MPSIGKRELERLQAKALAHDDYLAALRAVRATYLSGAVERLGRGVSVGYAEALMDIAHATEKAMKIRQEKDERRGR